MTTSADPQTAAGEVTVKLKLTRKAKQKLKQRARPKARLNTDAAPFA